MVNYYSYKSRHIWLSFFIAFLIQVMPWPSDAVVFQPNWVLLTLVYWLIRPLCKINISTSFILGIILDFINGSTLGIYALAMSIVTYLIILKLQIFRNLILLQQALTVILLSLIVDSTIFFVDFFITNIPFKPAIFWGSIVNGVLWPWLFLLMNKIYQ